MYVLQYRNIYTVYLNDPALMIQQQIQSPAGGLLHKVLLHITIRINLNEGERKGKAEGEGEGEGACGGREEAW